MVAVGPLADGGGLRQGLPVDAQRPGGQLRRPDRHCRSTPASREIFAGQESAQYFGVSNSDPHHPDVFGISQVGTIYTTGSKIAEHGGANPGDRDVPLVVYAPGTVQPGQSSNGVETTQVAPTILKMLGLSPSSLQAVQQEGTQVLPGLGHDGD